MASKRASELVQIIQEIKDEHNKWAGDRDSVSDALEALDELDKKIAKAIDDAVGPLVDALRKNVWHRDCFSRTNYCKVCYESQGSKQEHTEDCPIGKLLADWAKGDVNDG